MSTNALIALHHPESECFRTIYLHWDGYVEHAGKILVNHYDTFEKVLDLIDLGNLSVLGETLGEKHNFSDHVDGVCTAYGRDRGEANSGHEVVEDTIRALVQNGAGIPYLYLFMNNSWLMCKPSQERNPKFYPIPKEFKE